MRDEPVLRLDGKMPWGFLATLCTIGVMMSGYFLIHALRSHTWHVPLEAELQSAKGKFQSLDDFRGPYIFRLANGRSLFLSCFPESTAMHCVNVAGSRNAIIGKEATIKFFYVDNYRKRSLSNVLMDAAIGDDRVTTYSERKKILEEWSTSEDHIHRYGRGLIASSIPTIFCFAAAAVYFFGKLNRLKQEQ